MNSGVPSGGVAVSFFIVIGEPGRGTRLDKQDYDEVVYVMKVNQSGRSVEKNAKRTPAIF
jgi:hypothetical protein